MRAVTAGRRLLSPSLRHAASTTLTGQRRTDARIAGLGIRERQILSRITEGSDCAQGVMKAAMNASCTTRGSPDGCHHALVASTAVLASP